MASVAYANFIVAGSYFAIAVQILTFASNSTVQSTIRGGKAISVLNSVSSLFLLFASFIALSGGAHLIHGIMGTTKDSPSLRLSGEIVLISCAAVSVVAAVTSFFLLPTIVKVLGEALLRNRQNELNESYMIDIIHKLKESVIELSAKATIVRGNAVSISIFGAGFVGQHLPSLVHREDRELFESTLQQVLSSPDDTPACIEYRVKAVERSVTLATGLSSSFRWVESTFCKGTSLLPDGTVGHDVKMISRSIDERKRSAHYRQYYQQMKEKEAVNEAKLRYISCIAHDLKTPLQSFCFTVDLLSNSGLTPAQLELLDQTNVAVDLMKLTISQTMDIRKALTGAALQPRRRPLQLSSVIQRVSIIINGYGKQVPVTFEVSPIIYDTIITDEEWLWQMLLNLLTNACKYTDRGEIQVKVSLTHEVSRSSEKTATFAGMRSSVKKSPTSVTANMTVATGSNHLLFEVCDTGVGIREEKLESIFEAFAQVQTGQVTGTGLGLFGVCRRAEGLQGACGARHNTASSTGTGTVIWFSIPYVIDHTESLGNSALDRPSPTSLSVVRSKPGSLAPLVNPATLTSQIRERGLVAMVVDDTLSIRKLMERTLLQLGFERVVCFENGSKGLDALMAEAVDIVFTDVQMPIMTGPEMVQRFRTFEAGALASGTRSRRQMIVAVSANSAAGCSDQPDGFDFICSKPLGRTELYSVLYQYLGDTQGV